MVESRMDVILANYMANFVATAATMDTVAAKMISKERSLNVLGIESKKRDVTI